MTIESGAASTTAPGGAEILLVEEATLREPGAYRFSPLVSWLVATAKPEVTVELGPGDERSLASTCDAVLRSGHGRTCSAVVLGPWSEAGTGDFAALADGLTRRFGQGFEGYASEEAGLAARRAGGVGLLHISLFDAQDSTLPDLDAWRALLAPGAIVVVTTTSDAASPYAEMKRQVTEAYPAVSISLGPTVEAVVAQTPEGDATPVVDALRKAPFVVGAFLAVLGEEMELHHLRADEPEPSEAVRALIGRVIDQQHAERHAFLTALRAYKDEAARLSEELGAARRELGQELEAARLEREHLVAEFLDRVDELSAKVSTTASRARAELADAQALLEAEGRKAEAYAGQAAIAQSVVDDIRSSTSWRVTAPVRIISRLLARRAQPPVQPEH
jgi:hypothetical protein